MSGTPHPFRFGVEMMEPFDGMTWAESARELAAIDILSEGRLEVGLGAGYQVNDYRSSGIVMDPPKVRVDRLIEYVAVLRGLFADGPFSYDGEHFQIDTLDGTPHPFTPGGPPIF